ncbi:hypothetical protein ACLKA7_005518 [Drosophila subpalustris]
MSGSLDEISSKISSAPAWISQSAADCERSNKLKRFRIKNKLDTPYSRQSSIKPAENLHPLPAVSTLSTTLTDVGAECHSNPASAKRKSSPPSPHGTPKTQKLVPQPYAGHGNSSALLTSLDDNDDMDVEVPANPFVDGTSCDASRSLGAPRSQDAPRTQVSPPRPTSPRPPPFIIAGLTGLREITALVKTVTNNFKIKNIGSSSARLTVEDGKTYREVQNLLQDNEIPYNSWQPKEERSFRVVARGLHSDTDKQDISDYLTALDHKSSTAPALTVSLSVDQDPSQWPVLGNPVTSGASSRPLSTAASSSPCGVSVLHQPAQERLLQQILSLQAAQQKDAHAQSSSVEKLLSRLDQMMALLMQVMGKSKLTSLLINDPPYALDTTNDIDFAAEDLVEKIHTAAAASMVNHRNVLPLGPPRAPLKPEFLALLRRKRELRRRWMRTRHPLDQAEFKAATDVLWKALFEAKSEFFVEKLRAIDPNQNRGFDLWKCTRGLKRQPLRRFSLLRRDGTWARSDLEIAEEFATDLSERFTPFDLASDEEVLATTSYAGVVPGPSVPIRQIDVPEVVEQIKRLKPTKAPGHDGLDAAAALKTGQCSTSATATVTMLAVCTNGAGPSKPAFHPGLGLKGIILPPPDTSEPKQSAKSAAKAPTGTGTASGRKSSCLRCAYGQVLSYQKALRDAKQDSWSGLRAALCIYRRI